MPCLLAGGLDLLSLARDRLLVEKGGREDVGLPELEEGLLLAAAEPLMPLCK
jgi:hypothetical protein